MDRDTAGPSTALRSGWDDNFVQNSRTSAESTKSQAPRMTILCEFDKKHPKQVSAYRQQCLCCCEHTCPNLLI